MKSFDLNEKEIYYFHLIFISVNDDWLKKLLLIIETLAVIITFITKCFFFLLLQSMYVTICKIWKKNKEKGKNLHTQIGNNVCLFVPFAIEHIDIIQN